MKIKEILIESDNLKIETFLALKYNISLSNYDKSERAEKLINQTKTNENLNQIRSALINANNNIQKLLNSSSVKNLNHYEDFYKFQIKALHIMKKHSLLINKIDELLTR